MISYGFLVKLKARGIWERDFIVETDSKQEAFYKAKELMFEVGGKGILFEKNEIRLKEILVVVERISDRKEMAL